MFIIGEYVMHSGHGLCTILDQIYNATMNKEIYKLKAIHNNMVITMPCDKASMYLRKILTKDEILEVFNEAVNLNSDYIKDNKERKSSFQALITSNDINDTIHLLKLLYHLVDDRKKEKKSIGSFDSQFLQQAEKKLVNEVSISFDISKDEAYNFVFNRLKA